MALTRLWRAVTNLLWWRAASGRAGAPLPDPEPAETAEPHLPRPARQVTRGEQLTRSDYNRLEMA